MDDVAQGGDEVPHGPFREELVVEFPLLDDLVQVEVIPLAVHLHVLPVRGGAAGVLRLGCTLASTS